MTRIAVVAAVLALFAAVVVAQDIPLLPVATPVWPSAYTVTGTFNLPLAVNGGVHEPVTFIYDAANGRLRMEYYGGESTTLFRYDTGLAYEIVPRVDKLVCYSGPSGDKPAQLPTVLPDLTTWKYVGTQRVAGVSALNFETSQQSPAPSNFTSVYNFFVDAKTGNPVQFNMRGYNIIWGSHPDIYQFVFHTYKAGAAASAFDVPSTCSNSSVANERRVYRLKNRVAMINALHPVRSDDGFDHYAAMHNKHYHSVEERNYRRSVWAKNIEIIDRHNAKSTKTNKLAINQFGDLTVEERTALYGISVGHDHASRTHVVNPDDNIPASIDWRQKGAVTQVKDQGVCGSCWTFGSAAAFEGAYAIKYGTLKEFSEQQFLDCAYVDGNTGCDGGTAYGAYDYLLTTHGLSTEASYPYRMQDSYCKAVKKGVPIASYVNVTSGDEAALQHAVATVGPVTVAINTKDPLWYFHTGDGVYDSDNCPGTLNDLDHQVTVVGYGTQDGMDYWLVKNSYSPFWGSKGYIKMRRNKGNLCGIATQPDYVVF